MSSYPDGKTRCGWPGADELYVHYHDTEWGVPIRDHQALFEKLILDGFQAGLAWITILRKRDNFIAAFDGFDPEVIAGYGPEKIEELMRNKGIVRNRAKIEATVRNAQGWLRIMEDEGGFSDFIWSFTGGKTKVNHWKSPGEIPAETMESKAMSKALRARGFNFVGPTICYAFMQAVGIVNDHTLDCFRHAEV